MDNKANSNNSMTNESQAPFSGALAFFRSLLKQGVVSFVISPGSRSAPLVLALELLQKEGESFQIYVHQDERAAAFLALGMAHRTQEPSVVITTSGSAVGNLLPAAMEAKQSLIPLIFITADRPSELLDVGENQATDQLKIFSSYSPFHLEIPAETLSLSYYQDAALESYLQAKRNQAVSHVNWQLREPLYPTTPLKKGLGKIQSLRKRSFAYSSLAMNPKLQKRTLFVLGAQNTLSPIQKRMLIKRLSIATFPIFMDVRTAFPFEEGAPFIRLFEIMLDLDATCLDSVQSVVHIGHGLVSKALNQKLFSLQVPQYAVAIPKKRVRRTQFVHELEGDPMPWLQKLAKSDFFDESFLKKLQKAQKNAKTHLKSHPPKGLEGKLAMSLVDALPKNSLLFLGNSLPIRLINRLSFCSKLHGIEVYSQRGVSGIDGQLAHAAGIASQSARPLVLWLGDQTLLYDLSSLSLLRSLQTPFFLIVTNNQGGGIFDLLPWGESSAFEAPKKTFFRAPHSLSFENIAPMFSISYQKVSHEKELPSALKKIAQGESLLLEIQSQPMEGSHALKLPKKI